MKTLIFSMIGVLGLTLGAPFAEARDKKHRHRDHDRDRKHYHHRDHHRDYRSSYRSYRYYTPRYYSYPRSYGYRDGYYYNRRPGVTFSFGY
jgi:hypothetical protein